MQTMRLADDLFVDVLTGDKTCTIRLGQKEIGFGPLMLIGVADLRTSVKVNVHRIEFVQLQHISPEAIRADGAASLEELIEKLSRFYPALALTDAMTVIWIEPLLRRLSINIVDTYALAG